MKKPPLAQRLAVALLFEIASGNYKENTRFLSRREIMRQWKVSSPTAVGALHFLADWDILHASDRSGHHLRPQFLQKTLLRINKTDLDPLPGQPQWDDKARALIHGGKPLRQIAVISISDHVVPLTAKRHEVVPATVPLSLPIKDPAITIFREANAAGITVDFYFDDGLKATREQILDKLSHSRVQGVIILRRLMSDAVSPLARPLINMGLPVVTAFDDCENLPMVSVNFNNIGMGYMAAQQFIAQGHRHIAVTVPQEDEAPWYYRNRCRGCEMAAAEYMRTHPQDAVKITPLTISPKPQKAYPKKLTALLERNNPDRPTALFSTSVNLLTALQPLLDRLSIETPGDLSVIMCSSTASPAQIKQPIDIMKLDFNQIGSQALRALQALYGGQFAGKTWLVESSYEQHGTVTAPASPQPSA